MLVQELQFRNSLTHTLCLASNTSHSRVIHSRSQVKASDSSSAERMAIKNDRKSAPLDSQDPRSIANFQYCPLFCEENVYNLVTNFIDRIDETGLLPLSLTPLSYFYVVFISSVSKQTPLWQQKACVLTRPVLWDYHVILISKELPFYMMDHILATEYDKQTIDRIRDMSPLVHETNTNSNSGHMEEKCPAMFVYDLDSKLPFPTEGMEYCSSSIRPEIPLPEEHEQQFRVVSAHDFINNFASDRSHMEKSGAPNPDWPCIRSLFAQSSMNLHEYTTMIEEDSSIASSQSQADLERGIYDSIYGKVMNRIQFCSWCSRISD